MHLNFFLTVHGRCLATVRETRIGAIGTLSLTEKERKRESVTETEIVIWTAVVIMTEEATEIFIRTAAVMTETGETTGTANEVTETTNQDRSIKTGTEDKRGAVGQATPHLDFSLVSSKRTNFFLPLLLRVHRR